RTAIRIVHDDRSTSQIPQRFQSTEQTIFNFQIPAAAAGHFSLGEMRTQLRHATSLQTSLGAVSIRMMVLDSPGKGKLSPIGVTVITARATGPNRRRQPKHVLSPARCT